MSIIGQRIRDERTKKSLSQEELGRIFSVTQQAVNKWECGKSSPDPEMIKNLADFFGCTADYLVGRDNTPYPSPKPLTLEEEPTHQDLEEFLHTSNVQFNGAPLDEKDKEEIIDVLKYVWKRLRKDKDTPENK
ncbi:helix-turn-helix domain-containing protein [Desulfitobacterium sp. AusDCA]|uniref:helix-turn-helix domain-containing protein n=1 Tax=Desulfitobacterium sp. AusDCA TaxID=3240383 RepID=UPI003DA6DE0F